MFAVTKRLSLTISISQFTILCHNTWVFKNLLFCIQGRRRDGTHTARANSRKIKRSWNEFLYQSLDIKSKSKLKLSCPTDYSSASVRESESVHTCPYHHHRLTVNCHSLHTTNRKNLLKSMLERYPQYSKKDYSYLCPWIWIKCTQQDCATFRIK